MSWLDVLFRTIGLDPPDHAQVEDEYEDGSKLQAGTLGVPDDKISSEDEALVYRKPSLSKSGHSRISIYHSTGYNKSDKPYTPSSPYQAGRSHHVSGQHDKHNNIVETALRLESLVEHGLQRLDAGVWTMNEVLMTSEGRDKVYKVLQNVCKVGRWYFRYRRPDDRIRARFEVVHLYSKITRTYLKLFNLGSFVRLFVRVARLQRASFLKYCTLGRLGGLGVYFFCQYPSWLHLNKVVTTLNDKWWKRVALTGYICSALCSFAIDLHRLWQLYRCIIEVQLVRKMKTKHDHGYPKPGVLSNYFRGNQSEHNDSVSLTSSTASFNATTVSDISTGYHQSLAQQSNTSLTITSSPTPSLASSCPSLPSNVSPTVVKPDSYPHSSMQTHNRLSWLANVDLPLRSNSFLVLPNAVTNNGRQSPNPQQESTNLISSSPPSPASIHHPQPPSVPSGRDQHSSSTHGHSMINYVDSTQHHALLARERMLFRGLRALLLSIFKDALDFSVAWNDFVLLGWNDGIQGVLGVWAGLISLYRLYHRKRETLYKPG